MANLNYNRIILAGRLTKDPLLQQMATGTYIATFPIAVGRNYKRKDGVIPTDFFECILFEERAERICKWFSKGDPIMVEGSLQTKEYISKDGIKIKSFYISVSHFYFIDKVKKYSLISEQFDQMATNIEYHDDIPF